MVPRIKLEKLLNRFKTQTAVAKHLGVSRQRVHQMINETGAHYDKEEAKKYFSYKGVKDPQIQKRNRDIVREYKNGTKLTKDIAKKYGLSVRNTLVILNKAGLRGRKKRKIDDGKLLLWHSKGIKQKEIARRFGADQSSVSKTLKKLRADIRRLRV